MATLISKPFLHLLLLLILSLFLCPSLSKKTNFIVHMLHSEKPTPFASGHDWYSSILHSLSSSNTSTDETPNLLYTYSNSATGFAAHISAAHATKLRSHHSVLSVIPDQIVELATTQSPEFLGLSDVFGIWPTTNWGSDIVIGVVDSGIWPEHRSFDDQYIVGKPTNWRGICEVASDFPANVCNKKLIGARSFYRGYEAEYGPLPETKSPRDYNGHGTHCASVAGGTAVDDAGYYQYAKGQARGVAPLARISAYKAFWGGKASAADILAAIDQAIKDGVHVLSLSFGIGWGLDYYQDLTAVGAFRATHKGVVVSVAASNNGPDFYTVQNVAPWMLTVGASTINRQFPADVVLKNGLVITGSSVFHFIQSSTPELPLVTGETGGSRFCKPGELHSSIVAGKMVVCESGDGSSAADKSVAVQQAGGSAMILINTAKVGDELTAEPFVIPAATVSYTDGSYINTYITDPTKIPTARIMFRGTVISPSPSAPRVAAFSSRGPNPVTLDILKPDVIAPGVNILAAWTGADARRVEFNIMSGTSMACPHVSGLAAMLRKAYPSWSPAAIKSAIMTTAHNVDNAGNNIIDLSTGKQSSPIVHGSGHIVPNKALDPGLVYDLDTSDYIAFLCSIGYDPRTIAIFVQDPTVIIDCRAKPLSGPGDLNYPSLAVNFKSVNDVVKYTRVVKNVGSLVNAVYQGSVVEPAYVRVSVSPTTLVFNANRQSLSYTITFTSIGGFVIPTEGLAKFGIIEWSDANHRVRSPIAAYWPPRSAQEEFVALI